MMTELYRLTGRAKQSRAVAHVLRWCGRHPSGAKLLVFAHHAEMLDALQAALRARGVVTMRIDGGTAAKKRQDLVASFQDVTAAASPRVALLSINAAGQGLTLTAAHDVVSNPNPNPSPNPNPRLLTLTPTLVPTLTLTLTLTRSGQSDPILNRGEPQGQCAAQPREG